jgi:lipopolysaccharide export system permease protein
MRLLDRYLLRELLLPLSFCLGGFLVFWVAFDLFAKISDLQDAKMQGVDVVEYYFVRTPEILVILLPVALLLALLYTLTQLARHHEITAMRAAGISLWRLAAPYFAVGLVLSLAVFAMNELLVPDASEREEDLLTRRLRPPGEAHEKELVRNLGFTNSRERRTWQIGVFNLSNGDMRQPKVAWRLPDGTQCWLIAERAVFTNGLWAFFNVNEWRQSSATNAMLAPFLQTNFLMKADFTETPGEIRSEVRIAGRLSLRKAKQADIPLVDLLDYLRLHPQLQDKDHSWIYTKLHGRLAAPWTCLVVVLIALPFGAPSGRRNIFVGVASSIFICFTFFVVQQFGMALGSGGFLPPWLAAWLPNLAFGGAAVYLISRVR